MGSRQIDVRSEAAKEEEDLDDGPPPGFQKIITPQPPQSEKADDDDEDGPPPGFESIAPKPSLSVPVSDDMERSSKQQDSEDDDGPPPGWEFSALARALPKPQASVTVKNKELNEGESENLNKGENEDEDDGPPPGWEAFLSHKMPPSAPPAQPSLAISSDTRMESKQEIARNDGEAPKSALQSTPVPARSSLPTPPPQPSSAAALPGEMRIKEQDTIQGDKRPMPEKHSASPQQLLSPAPHPQAPSVAAAASSSVERAQLVCGVCRSLCTYPRGAKWVQCPTCSDVNYVLEANEVGQVKCKDCKMLLMYPYGAPAVQCTSCRAVMEIGDHNRRPPLSVQQELAPGRRRRNRGRQPG